MRTVPGSSPEPPHLPFRTAVPRVLHGIEGAPPRSTQRDLYRGIFYSLVWFCLIVWFLKSSIVEAFFVPSASMRPTVLPRDYILVPKLYYGLRVPLLSETVLNWSLPSRGDIIVFNRLDDPTTDIDEGRDNLVKRVIALPGEVVELRGQQVYVNGQSLDEPYAHYWVGDFVSDRPSVQFGPVTVPENSVFVLGDNRVESNDSRSWSYPFVKVSRIQGKAVLVYWSDAKRGRSGVALR